jgi:hypothetical protein
MGRHRRAALAGIQERGQVLELDLPEVHATRTPAAVRTRWNMIRQGSWSDYTLIGRHLASTVVPKSTSTHASGPPGVSKTLTAEALSEHLQRPLYIVRLASELRSYLC